MSQTRILKAGEVLFKEGDPSESMFVVKSGVLLVYNSKGEQEIRLAEMKTGEVFGEMSYFDRKPRSASVKALTRSELHELNYKALQAQFDALPNWVQALVRSINDHLREANERIKELERR